MQANPIPPMPDAARLIEILDQFPKLQLLVIGDLMLDRFIWGDVERISPEAPVPVLRVVSENTQLGGAANVIHNIRSLGGGATACGAVGKDGPGKKLALDLGRIGASTAGVFTDESYQSIQKTRVIARPRHQQIVRLDRENRDELGESTRKKIRKFVLDGVRRYDGIVVSDYGKGVIHEELLSSVAGVAARHNKPLIIDPKKENYLRYRHPTLITPNREEASGAAGLPIRDEASLLLAGERLLRLWRAKALLITRGPEGMSLFRPRRPVAHFPTQAREMFDVTGAGDTVIAVCSLALAAGARYEEAAVLANLAAGLVGDEVGTVAVPLAKLQRVIKGAP